MPQLDAYPHGAEPANGTGLALTSRQNEATACFVRLKIAQPGPQGEVFSLDCPDREGAPTAVRPTLQFHSPQDKLRAFQGSFP
jgi:hypothetical protein